MDKVSYVPGGSDKWDDIPKIEVDYKGLLKKALPYVLEKAIAGSHDAEMLQVEIEAALK